MRSEFKKLDLPAGVGSGLAFDVADFSEKYVQTMGTPSGGTLTVEGSMDGNTWASLGTLAAAGFTSLAQMVKSIRLTATGSPVTGATVYFGGRNTRTDGG